MLHAAAKSNVERFPDIEIEQPGRKRQRQTVNMCVIHQCQIKISIYMIPKMHMPSAKIRVEWRFRIAPFGTFSSAVWLLPLRVP